MLCVFLVQSDPTFDMKEHTLGSKAFGVSCQLLLSAVLCAAIWWFDRCLGWSFSYAGAPWKLCLLQQRMLSALR